MSLVRRSLEERICREYNYHFQNLECLMIVTFQSACPITDSCNVAILSECSLLLFDQVNGKFSDDQRLIYKVSTLTKVHLLWLLDSAVASC